MDLITSLINRNYNQVNPEFTPSFYQHGIFIFSVMIFLEQTVNKSKKINILISMILTVVRS